MHTPVHTPTWQVRLSPEAALLLKVLRRELDRCLMRHARGGRQALALSPEVGQAGQVGLGRASQAVVDAARALLARH